MKDVKITCPGPSGIGTSLEIEGKKISLTKDIKVHIPLKDAPKLTVERYMSGLEVTGKFDIDEVFIFPDRPGKRYRLVEVEEVTM